MAVEAAKMELKVIANIFLVDETVFKCRFEWKCVRRGLRPAAHICQDELCLFS